jgi:hypothetical protein
MPCRLEVAATGSSLIIGSVDSSPSPDDNREYPIHHIAIVSSAGTPAA